MKHSGFDNIIACSEVMQNIFRSVDRIANSDAAVMLCGETGTGKELLARCIHNRSCRTKGGFIPVDCVSLPQTLLETELFGHEKGAFTGAMTRRRGLIEDAHCGTIFLDEVCELDLSLQSKLLRVLQEHEFRRVGGNELIKVNFRIISATNREPAQAVSGGLFREDLYFRLNVIPFRLPALRDRHEDIPLLFDYFGYVLEKKYGRERKKADACAMKILTGYPWPGNVRELRNLVEYLTWFHPTSTEITPQDLPDHITATAGKTENNGRLSKQSYVVARDCVVQDFEVEYFSGLLQECESNMTLVAERAGISRTTLYRIMRKCGLDKQI